MATFFLHIFVSDIHNIQHSWVERQREGESWKTKHDHKRCYFVAVAVCHCPFVGLWLSSSVSVAATATAAVAVHSCSRTLDCAVHISCVCTAICRFLWLLFESNKNRLNSNNKHSHSYLRCEMSHEQRKTTPINSKILFHMWWSCDTFHNVRILIAVNWKFFSRKKQQQQQRQGTKTWRNWDCCSAQIRWSRFDFFRIRSLCPGTISLNTYSEISNKKNK